MHACINIINHAGSRHEYTNDKIYRRLHNMLTDNICLVFIGEIHVFTGLTKI